jgi:hypothetical protein
LWRENYNKGDYKMNKKQWAEKLEEMAGLMILVAI